MATYVRLSMPFGYIVLPVVPWDCLTVLWILPKQHQTKTTNMSTTYVQSRKKWTVLLAALCLNQTHL